MLAKNPILPLLFHNLKDCTFHDKGKMGRNVINIIPANRGGRRFGRRLSRLIRSVNRLLSECSR
jgi:hypothetical protein